MKIRQILLATVILGSVLCITNYSNDFSQTELKIAADRVGA